VVVTLPASRVMDTLPPVDVDEAVSPARSPLNRAA
jgi:two-component system cell cycle sensor histidine kinase PleC